MVMHLLYLIGRQIQYDGHEIENCNYNTHYYIVGLVLQMSQ